MCEIRIRWDFSELSVTALQSRASCHPLQHRADYLTLCLCPLTSKGECYTPELSNTLDPAIPPLCSSKNPVCIRPWSCDISVSAKSPPNPSCSASAEACRFTVGTLVAVCAASPDCLPSSPPPPHPLCLGFIQRIRSQIHAAVRGVWISSPSQIRAGSFQVDHDSLALRGVRCGASAD